MDNPSTTDSDVSVVLNLFKRPQNLLLQLDALKQQTLKPKEILLYQDGTSDKVNIPDAIRWQFDHIEISQQNKGVWARFDFAKRNAKSKYVCVFDDDTIPGSRWLENCHTEMHKQEGLYGTIGIIMKKEQDYPKYAYSSYFRVGWDGNLPHTTEVDFVGHSWFFKKIWLDDLFQAPPEIQELKLYGEDMAFSFQLLKKGIKTFVPPHPRGKREFFGSDPQKAVLLGTDYVAISSKVDSTGKMNAGIKILLNFGWCTLNKRSPEYIKQIEKELSENLSILSKLLIKLYILKCIIIQFIKNKPVLFMTIKVLKKYKNIINRVLTSRKVNP